MKARRRARSLALQALYEIDTAGHPPEEVIRMRLEGRDLSDNMQEFVQDIVRGVLTHREELDEIIHQFAPEWPVDQMAVVDRNILRIAIYEIGVRQDTPVKVAINEAIEIAKAFGSESAPRFVNGVLGTLAREAAAIAVQLSSDVDSISSSTGLPPH